MKKSVLLAAILCVLMTSCSSEKAFDAAGYVKSTLDAVYYEEYAEYAKIQGISEKEVRKIFEQDLKNVLIWNLPELIKFSRRKYKNMLL